MKKVFSGLKKYKKECVLAPLFKMLEAIFELIVPLVVASIIDDGVKESNVPHIWAMVGVLVALGVVGFVCSITAQYFSAKAAVGYSTGLRHDLFVKMHTLSFSDMDKMGTSTMLTRMTSDVNQVQTGVNLTLRLLLRSPFIVFGAMIMAFIVDAVSATVFAVSIPVLSLIVFGIMLITIPMNKNVQKKLDKVMGATRENLSGNRVIRAFCLEDEEIKSFNAKNQDLSKTQKFVGMISSLLNPLTFVIVNLAIVALIYIGAIRVERGVLTQGKVVALYDYMSQILVELIKFMSLIITITKSLACASRIEKVLEIEDTTERNENTIDTDKFILFDNVSLRYKGASADSLSNISFGVDRGETVGIIGGTGSGKSSLVNLIPHFYDSTEGGVYIEGRDVKSVDDNSLRDRIGIVMQKAVLFSGTIKENLLWGDENATDEKIDEALEISQAKDVVLSKSEGLDEMINQGGKNLSGGQRQRLSIARALVKNPEILILDDSTSALDYATEAKLRKAISSMKEKPTTFIVSQRTSSIMNADKIVVLDEGKMVGLGTHEELLKNNRVYQEIYYSQYEKKEVENG